MIFNIVVLIIVTVDTVLLFRLLKRMQMFEQFRKYVNSRIDFGEDVPPECQ